MPDGATAVLGAGYWVATGRSLTKDLTGDGDQEEKPSDKADVEAAQCAEEGWVKK